MRDGIKLEIHDDKRSDGNNSIYCRSRFSNGTWYTGLTFRDAHLAKRVIRSIEDALEREGRNGWEGDSAGL